MYLPSSCMEILETYYGSNMKSNTKIKISEMKTSTNLWKLKEDSLINKRTLNFIRKHNSIFLQWMGVVPQAMVPKGRSVVRATCYQDFFWIFYYLYTNIVKAMHKWKQSNQIYWYLQFNNTKTNLKTNL